MPKLAISRDSTGRFWALTSRRSSIPSSHPILKGHRSASVVLMDTCGRYDPHCRTQNLLREFRFKWSRSGWKWTAGVPFFAVKPCWNETKLRHCWLVSIDGHDLLNICSYKMIQQALEERAKFWAKTNVWGCSGPRVRSLASKALL